MGLKQNYGYAFERIWKSYPRKVGKAAAYRAFKKLKCSDEDVEFLVRHFEERKQFDANWIEGKFIPHLSTFLNGGRWDDEYPRVRRNQGTGRGGAVSEDDETSMRKFWQGVAARGGDVPDKYRHLLGGPVH